MTKHRQMDLFTLVGLLVLVQQLWGRCRAARLPRPSGACQWKFTTSHPDFSSENTTELSFVRPAPSSSAANLQAADTNKAELGGKGSQSLQPSPACLNSLSNQLRAPVPKRQPVGVLCVVDSQERHGSQKSEKTLSNECMKMPIEAKTQAVSGAAGPLTPGRGEVGAVEQSLTVSAFEDSPAELPHRSQQEHSQPMDGDASGAAEGSNKYREGTPSCGSSAGPVQLETRPHGTPINWSIYFKVNRLPFEPEQGSEGRCLSLPRHKFVMHQLAAFALGRGYDYAQSLEVLARAKEMPTVQEPLDSILSRASEIHTQMDENIAADILDDGGAATTDLLNDAVSLVKALLSTPMVAKPDGCLKTLPFIEGLVNRTTRTRGDVRIALDQLCLSFVDIKGQIDKALLVLEGALPKEKPNSANGRKLRIFSRVQKLKGRRQMENEGVPTGLALLRKATRLRSLSSPSGVPTEGGETGAPATAPAHPAADKHSATHSKASPWRRRTLHGSGSDTGATKRSTGGNFLGGRLKRLSLYRSSFRGGGRDASANAASGAHVEKSGSEST